MSIDLSHVTGISDSRGVITEIRDSLGRVIWAVSGGKVILEVEKITSDTYAGETTYTSEQFILLDIYPKTNGTVKVTYGGLTKTITDTSGAAEPNAQQVFFGTFNGVSDSVATPASGKLTIEGDYYAFGLSQFNQKGEKGYSPVKCTCVTKILDFGTVTDIQDNAFSCVTKPTGSVGLVGELIVPSTVKSIGISAFAFCTGLTNVIIKDGLSTIGGYAFNSCNNLKTVQMLGAVPPEVIPYVNTDGQLFYHPFGVIGNTCYLEQITVPKGCGNTYKTATVWSTYADYIVEES